MKTFVEIGTCDFDTNLSLIESGEWRGVMCEPVPKYYQSLVEQAKDISYRYNLNIENVAISKYNGSLEMIVSNDELPQEWVRGISHIVSKNLTSSRLSESPQNKLTDIYDYENTIKSNCLTLDSLLRNQRINHIDYLKMDVEGHELDILQNYSWRILPTFIKIEHWHLGEEELRSLLQDKGYIVYTEARDFYAVK